MSGFPSSVPPFLILNLLFPEFELLLSPFIWGAALLVTLVSASLVVAPPTSFFPCHSRRVQAV